MLLFVSNGTETIHLSNFRQKNLEHILTDPLLTRGEPLVAIEGYSLMPNHVHIISQQIDDKGISRFMQKVFTGYTLYFNKKYNRSGPLFAGVFKSKHLSNDRYLKHALSYVHMNPVELYEKRWKEGFGNIQSIEKRLREYEYSSLLDFAGHYRIHKKLLSTGPHTLYDRKPTIREMLNDAKAYYSQLSKQFQK
jgi:REP element-mobilizing transposase RayT